MKKQIKELRRALRAARTQLRTVIEDCTMALNDKWDRSDPGFIYCQQACERTVERIDAALAGKNHP